MDVYCGNTCFLFIHKYNGAKLESEIRVQHLLNFLSFNSFEVMILYKDSMYTMILV